MKQLVERLRNQLALKEKQQKVSQPCFCLLDRSSQNSFDLCYYIIACFCDEFSWLCIFVLVSYFSFTFSSLCSSIFLCVCLSAGRLFISWSLRLSICPSCRPGFLFYLCRYNLIKLVIFLFQSLSQALLQLRADMVTSAEENVQVKSVI